MSRIRNAVAALLLSSALAPAAAAPVDPALYSTLHWRLLGPFRAGWAEMIEGVPGKPESFYFGASGGGVWKTDDAGQTWTSLFDKGPSSAIGAIAIAPSNPNVIYAGGGQPEPRYDVQSGRGIYKSSDGGATWTDLGLHDTRYIGRIWVSPTDPNVVVVAAVGHFFGASDARGIYRSTDGGKTWTYPVAPGGFTGANDIAADPQNPRTLFASTWDARQWPWQSYFTEISGPGSGVWRSDDQGAHWRRLSGGGWPTGALGRISLAATRKGGHLRVYADVNSKTNGGLWRSDDGGTHWQRVNPGSAFSNYYFNRITADPRNPDIVYLTGQSMRRCDQGGAHCEIFRGSPGGDDYHSIWIDPKNPGRMAEGSDQGAAVSVNGSRTWSSWYNQPTGQFYHLAADNRFPYWVYSGQQDSGTVGIASRSDYGAPNMRDWHPVGGDERDYDIPDPVDPNIVFGSGLGGRVSRWDARTGQVTDVSPWPVSNYGLRPTTVAHHFNWVTPLVSSRAGPPSALPRRRRNLQNHSIAARPGTSSAPTSPASAPGRRIATAMSPSKPHCPAATAPSPRSSRHRARPRNCGPAATPESSASRATAAAAGRRSSSRELRRGARSRASTCRRSTRWPPTSRSTASGSTTGARISSARTTAAAAGPRSPAAFPPTRSSAPSAPIRFAQACSMPAMRRACTSASTTATPGSRCGRTFRLRGRATCWSTATTSSSRRKAAPSGCSATSPCCASLAQTARQKARSLFTPAAAYRVRFDNNHDTPLAPETPVGENPPQGAVIDYWLPAAAKGPVTLEIRDPSGAVVRRFSSTDRAEELPAERYFAADWVRPEPSLAGTPGAHRWVWDLRRPRPKAVSYNYSIAAIWGLDTPLDPRGQFVEPGRYTAVLTADGRQQTAPSTCSPIRA